MENVDCAVIGAGVVGLAIARALAVAGREVVVLEAADTIGAGASSRNSEVIHAGVYHDKDSLKARFCVRGKELLYDYLAARGVAHRRCGKLIAATSKDQLSDLVSLRARAEANGICDLEELTTAQARKLEPAIRTAGALLSPSSGILDTHGLMLALQGDAEDHGAMVALLSAVAGGEAGRNGILLRVASDKMEPMEILCRAVINSAGLNAQAVASSIAGMPADGAPPLHLAKGNYFALNGSSPFSRLVYPLPGKASLGIHFTIDLGGQARFGPDEEWVENIDYTVNPARGEKFYATIRKYWPELPDNALTPGYSGIRPRLQASGEAPCDFVIQGPAEHGVPGLINLFGIESPGLTSCLAIAEYVAEKVADGI